MVKKEYKKQRTDAKINQWKIAKIVLKSPLKTERQIAQEANLSKTTVHEHLSEIKKTKDDRIISICDTDIENVVLWQNLLQQRLHEQGDTLKVGEIVDIIQEWTKRYTLFKWDITDKDGGLRNPLTPEEQKQLLERFKLDE